MLESYGLIQTVAPASEPVTVAEAKAYLRVEHSSDDTLIGNLITAARRMIEQQYGRQLVTATWKLTLDWFPSWEIVVPRGPLVSVSSIVYVATDGTSTTMDSESYTSDITTDPGRITPAYGLSWPATRDQVAAVAVTYTAGYGTASSVPEQAKLAIKMLVGYWYETREAGQPNTLNPIPFGVDALCQSIWPGVYA